jgi:membrane protease YdiL (CAAX protease family)
MIAQSVASVVLLIGWLLIGGASRLLGGLGGTLWLLALTVVFLRRYVVRASLREQVRFRIRCAGWRLRPVLLGSVALGFAVTGAWLLVTRFGFSPGEPGAALPQELREPGGLMRALYDGLVFAPLVEELLLRGRLLGALRTRIRPIFAVLLSAFIFACLHLQAWGVPGRFFFGIVCGMAVLRTRSIWPAVLLHAFNNGLVIALAFVGPYTRWFQPWKTPALIAVVGALWLTAVLCAIAVWAPHRRAESASQTTSPSRRPAAV